MGTDRTVILTTQMRREQCDTPHRRPVPQIEGIAVQMLEDLGRPNLGRGDRTATLRGIGQGGHLIGRVPLACGQISRTPQEPSAWCQSAGYPDSKWVCSPLSPVGSSEDLWLLRRSGCQ